MPSRRPSLDFWLWLIALSVIVIVAAYLSFPEKVVPPAKGSKIEHAG